MLQRGRKVDPFGFAIVDKLRDDWQGNWRAGHLSTTDTEELANNWAEIWESRWGGIPGLELNCSSRWQGWVETVASHRRVVL